MTGIITCCRDGGINVRQYRTDAEQKMLEMREPISHKVCPKASLMLQYRRDIADGTLDCKKLDADVRMGSSQRKAARTRWDRLMAASPKAVLLKKTGRSATVAKTPENQSTQVVELLHAKQA